MQIFGKNSSWLLKTAQNVLKICILTIMAKFAIMANTMETIHEDQKITLQKMRIFTIFWQKSEII